LKTGEAYTFTVIPTHTRYYNDSFGIYEFYTEQEDVPYLTMSANDDDFWGSAGKDRKTVYTGIMLGVSQALEHGLPYNLTGKPEYSDKFKAHQYRIMNISPVKPATLIENKRFLHTILTERQANTLIEAYPNIVDTKTS
jgi:hypothetical protein